MSMPPPQSGAHKAKQPRSPPLRALGPNSLMSEITPSNPPQTASPAGGSGVEPAVLADAMSKIDTLRQKTPAGTAATSPVASGASSPKPLGLPSAEKLVAAVQDARSGPGPVTGTSGGGAMSVPGTPHFGAQTGLCVDTFLCAGWSLIDRLKTLDESTRVIRQSALIPSRASSVSGIGTVGMLRCAPSQIPS